MRLARWFWHATDVSIACTAGDLASALANPGDASFSLSTNVPAGTETPNAATGTRSVCDAAGNCATAGPIGGNKVDKKPPTISISSPSNTTYAVNQAVPANYTCSDGGSGMATCAGTIPSGSNVATGAPGTFNFQVNAADNVGNTSSQSVTYSVSYRVCLLHDTTVAKKSGSTYLIKIQLCDTNGANLSSSATIVHAVSVVLASTNAPGTLVASGNANPDMDFRYDATLGGYIFNLSTSELGTGTYNLTFTAGNDPVPHSVSFQVK